MKRGGRALEKQIVTFELRGGVYGIDIMLAQEVVRLDRFEIREIPNRVDYFEGVFDLRGEFVPLIDLKKLAGVQEYSLLKEKRIFVVSMGDGRCGFVIDKILKVFKTSEEVLEGKGSDQLLKKEYILGVLECGVEKVFLLDLDRIFHESYEKSVFEVGVNLDFDRGSGILNENEKEQVWAYLEGEGFRGNRMTRVGILEYFSRKKKDGGYVRIEDLINSYEGVGCDLKRYEKERKEYFFDDGEDYRILERVIRDSILTKREKKNERMKILNIGCGGGEELYSMSLLLELYMTDLEGWEVEVVGLGSEEGIEVGRKGIYREEALRMLDRGSVEEYFEEEEGVGYRVIERVKRRCRFERLDMGQIEERKCDIIYSRGVFFDLGEELIEDYIQGIELCLNGGGVLVLSEIEKIEPMEYKNWLEKKVNNRVYFIKK